MTAAEQQALYEQTRANIQRHLDEITHLANHSIDPKAFFSEYLKRIVACLGAQGAALWQNRGQSFERIAEENFASSEFDTDPLQQRGIGKVLSELAASRKQYIIDAGTPGAEIPEADRENPATVINVTAYPFFFIPLNLGNRLAMVLQVWLKEKGNAQAYQEICAFLTTWANIGATFLRNHQGTLASLKNEELNLLVMMQSNLLGEHNPGEVAGIVANFTTDLVKSDMTCVFARHRKGWKLLAASNQEAVDERSVHVRALMQAVETLTVSDTPTIAAADSPDTPEPLREALQSINYAQVLYRLVGKPKTDLGDYLICAFRHAGENFSTYHAETLNRICEASGRSLEASLHHHRIPFRRSVYAISRINRYWQIHPRRKAAIYGTIVLILLFFLFVLPRPLRLTAECLVLPYEKSSAVAETGGKITAVYVQEGQYVTKSQVLAKVEDEDLRTQLAISQLESQRWKVESSRAQEAGMEAERKLADLNFERESQTAKRLNYLIGKTEIVAPHDGIVLTHNLHNREGEKLEIGTPFCEIASRENYDVVLDIKQPDIGDLLRALKQKGRLPVTFILQSQSQHTITAYIEGVEAVSEVAQIRKTASVFPVRVKFPENNAIRNELKSGYTGVAKVQIGTSNLAYSLLRSFLNYWRVNWGT